MDEPPDLLYRLIVHELTHQFQFDIIPTVADPPQHAAVGDRRHVGLHDRLWRPLDLMTVRDAAVADIVPKMSELAGLRRLQQPAPDLQPRPRRVRVHGSEVGQGRRARSTSSRCARSVIGGGDDAYQEAFQIDADEWDQQFDRYLKERFKPFRDKERPADYGRDLAPDPRKGRFANVLSIEPSPSGDLIAGDDRQRPRPRIRHRADLGQGRRGHPQPDQRLRPGAWASSTSRTPGGRWNIGAVDVVVAAGRPARLLRAHREGSLADRCRTSSRRKIEVRIPLTTVDAPESPDFSPDGKLVAFSGMRGSVADIFTVDLETQGDHQPHQGRLRRLRADLGARRQARSST